MARLILFLFTIVFGVIFANAQQLTGRIIDAQTKESIPFATIRAGETDLISNEDGYFTLSGKNADESSLISISFIGYNPQKISVSQLKQSNNIIALVQGSYEIGSVSVSNVKPDPNEIMKLVNENLSENYRNSSYKDTFFSRTTTIFKPKKLDIEIKKSTGLSKSDLQKANNDIKTLTSKVIRSTTREYSDRLFTLYKSTGADKAQYKLDMQKAITLKDENRSTNFEDMQKQSTDLFLKLLDTTKFYRIKSGLIGSRDTISFSKEFNEKKKNRKKEEKKTSRVDDNRRNIIADLSDNSILDNSLLDFVKNTDIYTYTYIEATFLDDDLVYVIDFKPRKRKAKFEGRLYVNESDYAVVRTDYKLAKGKTLEKLNLKLLLGVKVMEDVCTGTLIYKKNAYDNTYHHHYFSQERGQYFYVNRPLKFIELTDEKKDVVAFNFKIEGNSIDKTEFLNMDTNQVSQSEFDTVTEKEFEYQILKKYDSNIWKDYNIIEPLEEMKRFEVIE